MPFLIYLATEDDWCTLYTSDSVPDVCAITACVPAITLWDIAPHRETSYACPNSSEEKTMQRTPPLSHDTRRLTANGPFPCCYGACAEEATASVLDNGRTWNINVTQDQHREGATAHEFCLAHATLVQEQRTSAAQRFKAGATIEGPSMSDRTPPPKKGRKGATRQADA